MYKKLTFVFLSLIALSSAQAERPMVPLTQWVGQLPTAKLTGVDIYHHPDLLPFLKLVGFDPDQQIFSKYNSVPKVVQIDHYLIIQGYDCSLHECQYGHAILYDLDEKQAAICQQSLVWVRHFYPDYPPDHQPIEEINHEQHLTFYWQGDEQAIEMNDGDRLTACGGGLESDASGVLKRFLTVHKGDL